MNHSRRTSLSGGYHCSSGANSSSPSTCSSEEVKTGCGPVVESLRFSPQHHKSKELRRPWKNCCQSTILTCTESLILYKATKYSSPSFGIWSLTTHVQSIKENRRRERETGRGRAKLLSPPKSRRRERAYLHFQSSHCHEKNVPHTPRSSQTL